MRCYCVKGPGIKRYASTNADARDTRERIMDLAGCKKKDVTIGQVDVSLAKPELLDFINNLCEQSDPR